MSIQTVTVYPRARAGFLAGILACIFGVLGIVSWGIFFVPLAALCAAIGLLRGILAGSASGIGTSALGAVLTVFGFLSSPSLWALFAAGMLAQNTTPTTRSIPATTNAPPAIQKLDRQALPVAAPTGQEAIRTAFQRAETAIFECRENQLAGKLNSYVASAQCANTRVMEAFGAANYKHMDLVAWMNAKRVQVAERLDRKELTEIQAQAENALAFSEVVDAERRRDNAAIPTVDMKALSAAMSEMQTAMMECRERRLNGQLTSYVASVQCSNSRIVVAFSAAKYKYIDLIWLMAARRLEVAEREDRNQLTEAEARAEGARIWSELLAAERRRDTAHYR